ncbi:MAG: CDP-alcohol phosphatidyltransferase family protein [Acidobacteriota bacterium]
MPFNVANALTIGRIIAMPIIVIAAWQGRHDVFLWLAVYCMLSDIFDGKIARWLGQASEFGARLDSWADQMMVIGGVIAAALLQPQLIRSEAPFLLFVVGGNFLAIGIGWRKFGRLTSYHTTAARLMAYIAGAGAIVAITWGWPWLFRAGALVAIYSAAEEIGISFTLDVWTANVPSLAVARAIRTRTARGSTTT